MTTEQTMAVMSLVADGALDRWQEHAMYAEMEEADIVSFAQACTDLAGAASLAACNALQVLGERQTIG